MEDQLMLERNDELIDQFNKEEQRRQRILRRKRSRRKQDPKLSRNLQKLLDRLEKEIEKRASVDCVSKKWIG